MFLKKYRKRIADLEYKMVLMKWEIVEERKLYDEEMKKKMLDQKVRWVLGNGAIDLYPNKMIKRPIYNLTDDEAHEVTNAVYSTLKSMGVVADVWSSYNTTKECYVIGVKINEITKNQ